MSLSYYQQHKQERIDYQSFYNRINADKYRQYQREYHQKNKDKINEYRKKRAEQKATYKKPAKYKLDAIERVLRKKLKEINKTVVVKPVVVDYSANKYYAKKQLMAYQHSLPQAEPFTGFYKTPTGFALEWD